MNATPRFQDNGDGSILDTATGLTWTKEDSWQKENVWVTWDEALQHARELSNHKFCGHSDWRLPTRLEVESLYDTGVKNQDKYGKDIHLDPAFPSGPLPTVWIHEDFTGNEGFIFDFRDGEVRPLFKSKSGRMAVRPVRGGKGK